MASHPMVKWAQRTDVVYLTFAVSDFHDEGIALDSKRLVFRGTSENTKYEAELTFHAEIVPEESKKAISGPSVVFVLKKKDSGYWPRLLEGTGKQPHWLKTDFDKWKDEDDDDGDMGGGGAPDFGGMDFSQFGGGGDFGGGGFGGGDFGGGGGDMDDDDDDDLPDLEPSSKDEAAAAATDSTKDGDESDSKKDQDEPAAGTTAAETPKDA